MLVAAVSLRAMLWALHDAPCTDPVDKLVLWVLSDHADDEGRNALPAVSTIAATVPCDRATVQRHLRALEEQGLIRKGNQQAAMYLRADRRPTVWDLPLPGRSVRPRPELRGRTAPPHGAAHGAAPVRPEPVNQEINQGGLPRETAEGAVLGCASHAPGRSPACPDCQRVQPPRRAEIRPASGKGPKAARRALRKQAG